MSADPDRRSDSNKIPSGKHLSQQVTVQETTCMENVSQEMSNNPIK